MRRSSRTWSWAAAGLGAAVLTLVPLHGQEPRRRPAAPAELSFKIVSPGDNALVSGPTLVRALVLPPRLEGRVESVTFFVDGKTLCRVTAAPYECGWEAGVRIEEHVVRAVANLTDGTRVVHQVRTRGVEFVDEVDVNMVQVTAAVTDGAGEYVSMLPGERFRVFEDNVPQKVTYFAAEHTPLEVVVCVDVSGSMGAVMPTVRASVKKFLGALREGDQVTVLAFNDTVFTLGRRETATAGRLKAVDRLASWGGTALYDAILRALEMLGRQQGRRAIVVFSDGEDQSSHAPFDNVIRRVEASDATLYFIGLGRGAEVDSLKRVQERLSRVSGGRAFQTEVVDQLDTVFGQILHELSNQYLLAYQSTNAALDDTWRDIRVEVTEGDFKVRARQGYRAAPRSRTRPGG
ncbi:MAG: VWA domain-containing protein [Vicinamibacterales bacterium]